LRESARKVDKDPSKIGIYLGSYPNVLESPVSSNEERSPMTGTIEQIGSDIEQIKAMGYKSYILWSYVAFHTQGYEKMVQVTKTVCQIR
jgi:hypothetical protein